MSEELKGPMETLGSFIIMGDEVYKIGRGLWFPLIHPTKEKFYEFRSDLADFLNKWYPDYLPSIENMLTERIGHDEWKRKPNNVYFFIPRKEDLI